MLLVNKSGRIYDVPEQLAKQYMATKMKSREEIDDLLSTLRKPATASAEIASAECGCCCIYSNYCPNK